MHERNERTFKNFILDEFQIKAIEAIEHNHSVVVSAQTGTGKTLIADYIISKYIETGKKVIYTAPIKALSNQKYKEFKASYGEDRIGIITGDVVINSRAQVLIMTTEIYRNMLVTRDASVENISYVVFDEIHYINDIERGTVWEESVIFSPKSIRFLCLSATIPNAKEFAHWIETIKEHTVEVVHNPHRAVPLIHKVFDGEIGLATIRQLREHDEIPEYDHAMGKRKKKNRRDKHNTYQKAATHHDLISEIEHDHLFPAIYFIFSRAACEKKALELIRTKNLLRRDKLQEVIALYNKHIKGDIQRLESSRLIKTVIMKGVGVHHAGLLPQQKDLVEELFEKGLIAVLYATETFAVGINMPAKCVMFNSLFKYDGITFRYLNSKEYFQLAGRAGRRGIDKEGLAIALIDRRKDQLDKIERLTAKDVDPIKSQFNLSYNTVLNLLHRYSKEEIEFILKSSFDYYLRKKQTKDVRIMASFNHRVQILKHLNFIDNSDKLTAKGIFAMYIYANELLITEIFATTLAKELTDEEIILIVAAIMFEGRRGTLFDKVLEKRQLTPLIKKLQENKMIAKKMNWNNIVHLSKITSDWIGGASFEQILSYSTLQEGDYIRIFRQVIDMLRQIRRASQDYDVAQRMEDCIKRIDRDIVKVEL